MHSEVPKLIRHCALDLIWIDAVIMAFDICLDRRILSLNLARRLPDFVQNDAFIYTVYPNNEERDADAFRDAQVARLVPLDLGPCPFRCDAQPDFVLGFEEGFDLSNEMLLFSSSMRI